MIDKTKLADALTKTRLIGSPLILLPFLVFGIWSVALGVAFVLILTDAFDGYFVRKANQPRTPEQEKRGGQMDENADGMLTNALLGGVAINFVFVQNDFSWSRLVQTVVVLAVAGMVTVALMIGTKCLPMPWCKWADILNAVYYGFLLAVAVIFVIGNMVAWSTDGLIAWLSVTAIAVAAFIYAKRDRLFKRDDRKYEKNPA